MHQAFDTIASGYDASFTYSLIGMAQREIVWRYLKHSFGNKKALNILELNSGTGEDALWFTKEGHKVLATDISEKMIGIIGEKIDDSDLSSHIRIMKLDIREIESVKFEEKFDLIFSNFGGMNCISPEEINGLPAVLSRLLMPKGRLIMVIMPKYCIWETKYFLLKLNPKKAFRRYADTGTIAKLSGQEFNTSYYNPAQIKKMFDKYFNVIASKPVGFFIPPSYLEKFFESKRKTFNILKKLEDLITNLSYLASFSDHYLIDFQVKE
ncbi:MAG: methyltransferase domain-containing protein [Ignavibacteriaceae bacterium]